jgi:hypothetical protein
MASTARPAVTDWEQERNVMRRIRLLTGAIFVASALAVLLGRHPHGVGYLGYFSRSQIEAAAVGVGVLLFPGLGVLLRPTRPVVLAWMCWGLPFALVGGCILFQAAIMAATYATGADLLILWPAWTGCALAGASLFGIVLGVPIVRASHRRPIEPPPALPRARVHRR